MTFFFDGGKVLRCQDCGFRMYLGPWDLDDQGWWTRAGARTRSNYKHGRYSLPRCHLPCLLCYGEMVETHVGRADGWEEIEAVPA